MTTTSFIDLGLSQSMVRALERTGIVEPFPIQAAAIPDALAGRDIKGKAPTGSGKTLAFGLPLLSRVAKAGARRPRAMVLTPTRELAEQISRTLSPIASSADRRVLAVFGGVAYGPQRSALNKGVDVLVATPGRLEDLVAQGIADLSEVAIVVVDEADRMADMGFLPAVQKLLDRTRSDRQTMLFSATLDGDVAVLSRRYQTNPVIVESQPEVGSTGNVAHHFWRVHRDDRLSCAAQLINESGRSIVFTRTRRGADRLVKQLATAGVSAVTMHGGRSQSQRTRALTAFSTGRAQALVATDVAARGIHVEDVVSVIHYDAATDHKDYVHRSGRTARAGASGSVVTLVTADQERDVRAMQRKLGLNSPLVAPRMGAVAGRDAAPVERSMSEDAAKPGRGVKPASRVDTSTRPGSRSIFVGNLPWDVTESDLESLFSDHGVVDRATIVRRSGRSKGYGFVEMPERDGAVAIKSLLGASMGGRSLQVRFAR